MKSKTIKFTARNTPLPGWPDYPGLECAGVIDETATGSRRNPLC